MDHIGSEMKSVGEVMALGRSFPEALQKAVRMLNIGSAGLSVHPYSFKNPMEEVEHATDRRLFAIYEALKSGKSVGKIHKISGIDTWFLSHLAQICAAEQVIKTKPLTKDVLHRSKKLGFSDKAIAVLKDTTEDTIRKKRLGYGIRPAIKQIDTLAGEFDAETNYLYVTYNGEVDDVKPLGNKAVTVIGSGPYCIGSSVEFDWCAVNTAKTLQKHGKKTIIVNSNPETVSTDFDRSDRLYFEELTLERIRDILDFETPQGTVVSVGGQIANNLAVPLAAAKYPIMGTSATGIDGAEDRQQFSSMLGKLGIDQPAWEEVTTLAKAKKFAASVGFPVFIRPSYVLSGGAMNVVRTNAELNHYLKAAAKLSPDHPVVMSQFITNAKELEIDGVANNGELAIYAISEHIENAGVHSGDATVVYPAQNLYLETVRRAKRIAKQVVKELNITGPFNIQFIAKDNDLKVIECNVRASRSFPFVSKVSGYNFIAIATEAMLGIYKPRHYQTLELDHVAVKTPQFSYNRLKGADPVAGVEMASTGEVACFGSDVEEAFYTSWLATEQRVAGKSVFISVPDSQKHKFVDEARALVDAGWQVYTTSGTQSYFWERGIKTHRLHKLQERKRPTAETIIEARKLDLVVCVPSSSRDTADAYRIRRLAIDNHVPLITNAETGHLLLRCLADKDLQDLQPKPWDHYVHSAQ